MGKRIGTAVHGVLAAIGLTGVPDDLQGWWKVLTAINHDMVRWALFLAGTLGLMFLYRQELKDRIWPVLRKGYQAIGPVPQEEPAPFRGQLDTPIDHLSWDEVGSLMDTIDGILQGINDRQVPRVGLRYLQGKLANHGVNFDIPDDSTILNITSFYDDIRLMRWHLEDRDLKNVKKVVEGMTGGSREASRH